MALKDFLAEAVTRTETCLEQVLPPPQGPEARLNKAMRYSVLAGGKRLRPALFLATLKTFSLGLEAEEEVYLPFAAALEMIHTYSLIHDDLPAMDNDDWRRGCLTCHKAFDEATAILAGDALLTHAFAIMMKLKRQVSPERLLQAMEEVALSAGTGGMVAGQAIDLALTGQKANNQQLRYMVQRKTGALFGASIISAAHLAGATRRELKCLRAFSEQLGLSFQISDDILDMTGNQHKLGKTIGSDAKNGKTTFVSLLGQEQARQLALQTAEAAEQALAPLVEKAELLLQFPKFIVHRDN
jgi:geranylgeranyl diphosphate synthase type II